MKRFRPYLVPLLVLVLSVTVAWVAWPRGGAEAAKPPLPLVQDTSRDALEKAADAARARLAVDAADAPAAIRLAGVLLRLARVEMNAAHAIEAEKVLKAALKHEPGDYSALKMLGAVYLSQHRFAEAVDVATRHGRSS